MEEMLNVDMSTLFDEIVERGREQGVTAQEAYGTLVDEVVEDRRRVGEIHDDDPTEDMAEQLRARWPDYVEALGLDETQPQL